MLHDQSNRMEIARGVQAIPGLPALLVGKDHVVIADLHLGYEEALYRDGVYLPRVQLKNAIIYTKKIVDSIPGSAKLVIAGDIKHVFNKLLRQEKEEVSKFLNHAQSLFKEVIVIRGNHDNYISPIIKSEGAEFIEEHIMIGNIMITHGHKKPDNIDDVEVLVLGHEHPAIQVRVGGSRVKFPVILKVPLDLDATAIVVPAIGVYQTGNIVSTIREAYLSPIIKSHGIVTSAIPYIIDESEGIMELTRLDVLEQVLG